MDELRRVLALIEAEGGPDAPVVFLGDYVDRGPDARGVLDRLSRGTVEGRPWTCLLGNHDRLFRTFLKDGALRDGVLRPEYTWLAPATGGRTTLASYIDATDVDWGDVETLHRAVSEAVPDHHRAFLDALRTMHVTDDHVFVHAGIRPGRPLTAQTEDDLVWIREPFLSDRRDHGRLVVHGHTVEDEATHHGNRLALDTGAAYGAPATAALIRGRAAWALMPGGRVPLRPPGG